MQKLKKLWNGLSGFWKGVVYVAGIILLGYNLMPLIKSDKEKFLEEETISGEIKPQKLIDSAPLVGEIAIDSLMLDFPKGYDTSKFYIGNVKGIYIKHYASRGAFSVFTKPLYAVLYRDSTDKDIDLMSQFLAACTSNPLYITVREGRAYVKTDFKDINTGRLIGKILYDKWILYKDYISDWYSTDSCLEVRDKQGYIVLSLRYIPSGIVLNGYFMDATKMLVLNNSASRDQEACFDMREEGWKFKAATVIQSIPSANHDTFSGAPF